VKDTFFQLSYLITKLLKVIIQINNSVYKVYKLYNYNVTITLISMIYKLYSLLLLMSETSSENKIILFIKKNGPSTLQEIADNLGITKMGAYKHIVKLERKGLISRKVIKKEIGRPTYVFDLTESGKLYFTNSDSLILLKFLDYIKREGKDQIVIKFLKDRFKSLYNEYKDKLDKKELDEKVEILGKLRTSEGYMAEVKKCGNSFELIEFNCPIYRIASLFGEACSMERDLFSKVLDAEVENSHRQVNNSNVCRFIIKPKSKVLYS